MMNAPITSRQHFRTLCPDCMVGIKSSINALSCRRSLISLPTERNLGDSNNMDEYSL